MSASQPPCISNVRKHIIEAKKDLGFRKGKVEVECIGGKELCAGQFSLKNSDLFVRLNPGCESITDKHARAFARKAVMHESPIEAVGKDVGEHEIGHGVICPVNAEKHFELFIGPIGSVLDKIGKKKHTKYVANALQDIIVNFNNAERRCGSGHILGWHHEAKTKGFTRFYEGFVKLNLYLMGDNNSNETPSRKEIKNAEILLKKHFSNDPEVCSAVQEFIDKSGLGRKRNENKQVLLNEHNWKTLSFIFADCFGKLLEEGDTNMNSSLVERDDWRVPDDLVYKRYLEGKPLPNYIERVDALERLYDRLAAEIPVHATTEASKTVININYRFRFFDPFQDDISAIRLTRFGINQKGEFSFKVPKYKHPLKIAVNGGMKDFPTVCVGFVDGSGTMRFGLPDPYDTGDRTMIPWGNKSRYHYTLLGVWGIDKFFKKNGILTNLIGMIFSDETHVGNGSKNAKRTLLNPQFMGTFIDISVFDNIPKGSVILTLSDGDIQNWSEIKNKFASKMSAMNYSHIQIGEESNMSADLTNNGLHVAYVRNGAAIQTLVLNLAVKNYIDYITE